jgi:hypothetical protein
MNTLRAILSGFVFMITGGRGYQPKEYAAETPKLDIREYLNGNVKAWGMFSDWRGKIIRRFSIKMYGEWDGDNGTIKEVFSYDDDTKEERIWKVTFQNDHQFTALADDIEGEAVGKQFGNSVQMKYALNLEVDGRVHTLSVVDWLHLVDKKHLLNRAQFTKFGFPVGEIQVAFIKE